MIHKMSDIISKPPVARRGESNCLVKINDINRTQGERLDIGLRVLVTVDVIKARPTKYVLNIIRISHIPIPGRDII